MIYKKLNLGILYRDNKIVAHRSLLKVLLNPIFRYFGYQISTMLNDDNTLGHIILGRCFKRKTIKWDLEYNEFDYIIKKRMIL